MLQRGFDLVASLLAILLTLPLWALIAAWIKLDSPGPVFYRGPRVGKGGRPFRIYKFRSMIVEAPQQGLPVTGRGDPRVTRAGRWLRATKLDELPQLLNVLKGEMSLVGPRPEDPSYVARYTPEQRRVLLVRPGIVSPATLRYRNEEALLGRSQDPEVTYLTVVLPDKLRIDLEYVERRTFLSDLGILLRLFVALFQRRLPQGGHRG